MKKLYSLLVLFFMSITTFAQTSPDRVLVRESSGEIKGFLAERIDSIFFDKIEGEVKANVQIKAVEEGDDPSITLSVTRTDDCVAFKIALVEPKYESYLSDEAVTIRLIDMLTDTYYNQDFPEAKLSGFDAPFVPDATYSVVTVGYDKYGIACSTSVAQFHTQKAVIEGQPNVECTVVDVKPTEFTIRFTANDDCSEFYICSFDAGTMMEQFQMWGAFMGFNTPSEMIAGFSQYSHYGTYTHTWTSMNPGTDYEVWVAMKDNEGNFAEPTFVSVTTPRMGDEGTAEVSISIGQFRQQGNDENGQPIYTQNVTFAPNSSTSMFHDMLIQKDRIADFQYDGFSGADAVLAYLKHEDVQDPWWNLYKTDTYDWVVDPGTTYMAYAIGQNILGEWGPLAEKEFATPGSSLSAPAKAPVRNICGSSAGTVRLPAAKAKSKGATLNEITTK